MTLSTEDKLELMMMPGRYGNAIDDRDWKTLERIFTPDAVFDVLGMKLEGLATISEFMEVTDRHPMAHLMTNIDITSGGDGKAEMRFRVIFPTMNDDGTRLPVRIAFGCYYDKLVKTPDGWRVTHRDFMRTPRDFRATKADVAKEARFSVPA